MDVFRSAGPSFDLEYPYAGIHHPVDEPDGLQVFRAHDVLVVNLQLVAGLVVGHGVAAAADLHAFAPVGRAVGIVQAHVTLARYGHAECAVAEHLDADGLPHRPADVPCQDLSVYLLYLLHVQFARQDGDVCKLCIELQGIDVRDVQLRGEVYLYARLPAIHHHRHVAGDDGGDAGGLGGIDDAVHRLDIFAVDDGIHRQIGLDALCLARPGNLLEVVDGEVVGRVGTHIQLPDAEVHGVGSGMDGGCQRLAGADRCHYLEFVSVLVHCLVIRLQSYLKYPTKHAGSGDECPARRLLFDRAAVGKRAAYKSSKGLLK